jgi:hypothetical protein
MTKIEKLTTAAKIADRAQQEVAFCRGQLARAYNRPRTGVLVPKFATGEEAARFDAGWVDADTQFAG